MSLGFLPSSHTYPELHYYQVHYLFKGEQGEERVKVAPMCLIRRPKYKSWDQAAHRQALRDHKLLVNKDPSYIGLVLFSDNGEETLLSLWKDPADAHNPQVQRLSASREQEYG